MLKFTARLLEVAPIKSYEGNEYSSVTLRSDEVCPGQLIKYKLDLNKVHHSSLQEVLDTDVEVVVDIVKGANSTASLKVVGVIA